MTVVFHQVGESVSPFTSVTSSLLPATVVPLGVEAVVLSVLTPATSPVLTDELVVSVICATVVFPELAAGVIGVGIGAVFATH